MSEKGEAENAENRAPEAWLCPRCGNAWTLHTRRQHPRGCDDGSGPQDVCPEPAIDLPPIKLEPRETGQPTDLGGLAQLVRSDKSEALTAGLGASTEASAALPEGRPCPDCRQPWSHHAFDPGVEIGVSVRGRRVRDVSVTCPPRQEEVGQGGAAPAESIAMTRFEVNVTGDLCCTRCDACFEFIDWNSYADFDYPAFCPGCGRKNAAVGLPSAGDLDADAEEKRLRGDQ
jgi:hypothetical protein